MAQGKKKRKKKRKGGPKGKARRGSSLISDHHKEGRQYVPPLKQVETLSLVSWRVEGFPDLLWLCGVIGAEPNVDQGTQLVIKTLDAMTEALSVEANGALVLTGHLSDFERVPEEKRESIEAAIDSDLFRAVFTEDFYHAMSLYEGPPGAWLVKPYERRHIKPDVDQGVAWVAQTVIASQTGFNEVTTAARMCTYRAYVMAG